MDGRTVANIRISVHQALLLSRCYDHQHDVLAVNYRIQENIVADSLVVQSKVKEAVKAQGLRMDSNFPDALNAKINKLVDAAAKRAKENGRGTLRPYDL